MITDEEKEKLYLVFAERLTEQPNVKGMYEYEFYFSEMPETVWAPDWNQQCPSACSIENLRPELTSYNKIERLYTVVPIVCICDNSCLSCQDMIDGIIACAWEDISEYEEYPEPFRLVFNYGEKYNSVESKLAQRHQFFSLTENKTEDNEE